MNKPDQLLQDLMNDQAEKETVMIYAQIEKDRRTQKTILILKEVIKWIVGVGISFLIIRGVQELTEWGSADILIITLLVAILIEVRRKEHGNRVE